MLPTRELGGMYGARFLESGVKSYIQTGTKFVLNLVLTHQQSNERREYNGRSIILTTDKVHVHI